MRPPVRTCSERRLAAPLLAWLLALLLVLAQSSTLMHRTLHGTEGEWQQSASRHVHAHLLSHLWGSHDKHSDCQLFDQFGATGLPVVPLVLSCPLVPTLWRAPTPVLPAMQFERFYSAQAPPVSV